MDEEKRLCGLRYATSLNFTEAEYEKALKQIDTPDNANQLLAALLNVRGRGDTCCINTNQFISAGNHDCSNNNNSSSSTAQERESSSSCYSSITSFPSSSNQSLESISQHQPRPSRKIYIDGSNVARTHSKDASFSWLGIKLCVDWFYSRHHSVKVFVPKDKCEQADDGIMRYLLDKDALVETPIGCNDDIFIIEAAKQNNGVIVSNDLFRDEKRFNDELQCFIHSNRLPYVFVEDLFIPANDPRGRSGPKLEDFLSTDLVEHGNVQHHQRLLGRTKSHQRYQRKKEYPTNQLFNVYQRTAVHSTRSLPIDQYKACISDSSQQSTTSANGNLNQNYRHEQVRRTISVVYTNSNSRESDVQSINARAKTALCRTKSHNV